MLGIGPEVPRFNQLEGGCVVLAKSATSRLGRKGPKGIVKATPGVTVGVSKPVPVGVCEGTKVVDDLLMGATMTVNSVVSATPAASIPPIVTVMGPAGWVIGTTPTMLDPRSLRPIQEDRGTVPIDNTVSRGLVRKGNSETLKGWPGTRVGVGRGETVGPADGVPGALEASVTTAVLVTPGITGAVVNSTDLLLLVPLLTAVSVTPGITDAVVASTDPLLLMPLLTTVSVTPGITGAVVDSTDPLLLVPLLTAVSVTSEITDAVVNSTDPPLLVPLLTAVSVTPGITDAVVNSTDLLLLVPLLTAVSVTPGITDAVVNSTDPLLLVSLLTAVSVTSGITGAVVNSLDPLLLVPLLDAGSTWIGTSLTNGTPRDVVPRSASVTVPAACLLGTAPPTVFVTGSSVSQGASGSVENSRGRSSGLAR
jgi:hypothetical protein